MQVDIKDNWGDDKQVVNVVGMPKGMLNAPVEFYLLTVSNSINSQDRLTCVGYKDDRLEVVDTRGISAELYFRPNIRELVEAAIHLEYSASVPNKVDDLNNYVPPLTRTGNGIRATVKNCIESVKELFGRVISSVVETTCSMKEIFGS